MSEVQLDSPPGQEPPGPAGVKKGIVPNVSTSPRSQAKVGLGSAPSATAAIAAATKIFMTPSPSQWIFLREYWVQLPTPSTCGWSGLLDHRDRGRWPLSGAEVPPRPLQVAGRHEINRR